MKKLLSQLAVATALVSGAVSAQQTMTYEQALAAVTDLNLQACLEMSQKELTYAHELTALNCSGKNVADDTGIDLFTGLKDLYLNDNNLTTITNIANMGGLEVLHIDNNNIQHSSTILSLGGSLKELSVDNNPIADQGLFVEMTHSYVSLSISGSFSNMEYVFPENNIHYVDVSDTPTMTVLGFGYTPNLRVVDASNSPDLMYLGDWYHAPKLEKLYLHGTQVADLAFVLNLNAPLKLLTLSDVTYCWQLDLIDNTMTIADYTRPATCDNQDDNNDFDGDGITNIIEANTGTSPYWAQ